MTRFSIIIPTFNRMDVLPEVLTALDRQEAHDGTRVPEFEVIVVDDGSTDSTWEWLQDFRPGYPLTRQRQENAGPAKARNWGVERADGDRVAFLGDDTVPFPGWLACHLRAADDHPRPEKTAVIGYTAWHERMRLNPFLRYINEYGLQFGYALIDDPGNVPFNFLYTSNLSLPRELLLEEPFNTEFPYPAWEDIELSYRLKKKGLGLIYESRARVFHDHPTDLNRFMARQEKAGYSAIVFNRLHPELGSFLGVGEDGPPPLPDAGRQRLKVLLARILHSLPVRTPRLWESVLRYCYIEGLQRGWRERVVARRDAGDP